MNLTDERRATALSWLRGQGVIDDPTLSEEAKEMAAIGLLICNDKGRFTHSQLEEAMADPSVLQVARSLIAQARGL